MQHGEKQNKKLNANAKVFVPSFEKKQENKKVRPVALYGKPFFFFENGKKIYY